MILVKESNGRKQPPPQRQGYLQIPPLIRRFVSAVDCLLLCTFTFVANGWQTDGPHIHPPPRGPPPESVGRRCLWPPSPPPTPATLGAVRAAHRAPLSPSVAAETPPSADRLVLVGPIRLSSPFWRISLPPANQRPPFNNSSPTGLTQVRVYRAFRLFVVFFHFFYCNKASILDPRLPRSLPPTTRRATCESATPPNNGSSVAPPWIV